MCLEALASMGAIGVEDESQARVGGDQLRREVPPAVDVICLILQEVLLALKVYLDVAIVTPDHAHTHGAMVTCGGGHIIESVIFLEQICVNICHTNKM